MEIEEAARRILDIKEGKDPTIKSRILSFLRDHPDHVYTKLQLGRELGLKPSTAREMVRRLLKERKIGRYRVVEKKFSYYGTHKAIELLNDELKSKGLE